MYKDVVYAPTDRADRLPLFLLYPCMYSVILLLRSVHQVYSLDEGLHRQERGDLLQPTQGMQQRMNMIVKQGRRWKRVDGTVSKIF